MGGSSSKRSSGRSERCCSSLRGHSQECFDYVFDYLSPRCSYLNEPPADEPSASSSSSSSSSSYESAGRHTANSHPLPSNPVLPDAYDDEEENQVDMAITASLEVSNFLRESSTSSMSSSYASDDDEEDQQIDMAIRASLKPPNSPRASSTLRMNPSYDQERSSRFDIGTISSSSQARENANHISGELGECGICFEVLSMPAICDPCGHVSCYQCLERIRGSTNSRCPRCREAITKVMRIYQ